MLESVKLSKSDYAKMVNFKAKQSMQDLSTSYGQVRNTTNIVCIGPSFMSVSLWVLISSKVVSSQFLNCVSCVVLRCHWLQVTRTTCANNLDAARIYD